MKSVYPYFLKLVVNAHLLLFVSGIELRSPPMGWTTQGLFDCQTNCTAGMNTCLSEVLIKQTIDTMAADGFRDRGYSYVVIGDCWSSRQRTSDGKLAPDTTRFPSGIPSLVKYAHSANLKLGLYLELGATTRHGYPGSKGHVTKDVTELASWGVDMVYVDAQTEDVKQIMADADVLHTAINSTGWSPLVSCAWPSYIITKHMQPDYIKIRQLCHTFRSTPQLRYSSTWLNVTQTANFYTADRYNVIKNQGSGHWIDLGMMLVGTTLPSNMVQTQMAFWMMMSSTVFLGADLRHMSSADKKIALRKPLLDLDQDNLDNQPEVKRQYKDNVDVWHRFMTYANQAILVVSWNKPSPSQHPLVTNLTLQEAGVNLQPVYPVVDVPTQQTIGRFDVSEVIKVKGAPVTVSPGENVLLMAMAEH